MTLQQCFRGKRKAKKSRVKSKLLKEGDMACPMRRGVVTRVFIATPRKPNSAQRKVATVKLTNGREFRAYIPDQTHKITVHSSVLVKGGICQDTPGTTCTIQRGCLDAHAWKDRKNKRSKYGVKKASN